MNTDISSLFTEILNAMGVTDSHPAISRSDVPAHGEYTTNAAMTIAKQLKTPPRDVALQVKSIFDSWKTAVTQGNHDLNYVKGDQTISVSDEAKNVLQDVDHLEVAGPGFLNVFVTEVKLSNLLSEVLKQPETVGTRFPKSSGKRVMVEFTDPNPFKEFHIGHLYSNAVGESLSRIFTAVGHDVQRADYFGDVGMHVAKSLWGLRKKFADDGLTIEQLGEQPLRERINYLGAAYAKGSTAYEEDETAKEEMKQLNYLVYVAAQEHMVKTHGHTPVVDYRRFLTPESSTKLPEIAKLYAAGREWSLAYFETIYARLGTKFDRYYPESVVGETGARIVMDHVGTVFVKSDGAVVFHGEEMGLHTRVFMNTLGLPTYEAKELGLAPTKYADFPYDASFIVTGNEINEYFRVLMAALSKIRPELSAKTTHIGHGMVRLKTGKMSSRTGQVITGIWLLDETKKQIRLVMQQNRSDYNEKELDEVSEAAAVAAIKYSFLKVSLPQDISFDFSESININGDSGPYLLYTYARCRSVLRKAENGGVRQGSFAEYVMTPTEREIARHILYFPETVEDAARGVSPSFICTYLSELAQLFNAFYGASPIITADSDQSISFRLGLTAATAAVMKKGLELLGITTVEKM